MFTSVGSKGAWGEAMAIADLLAKGYDVFHAASPACRCDLVIHKPGAALARVEVRCASIRPKGNSAISAPDRDRSDHCAIVMPNGSVHYDPPLPGYWPTVTFISRSTFKISA